MSTILTLTDLFEWLYLLDSAVVFPQIWILEIDVIFLSEHLSKEMDCFRLLFVEIWDGPTEIVPTDQ
jgi:hypothetical protein